MSTKAQIQSLLTMKILRKLISLMELLRYNSKLFLLISILFLLSIYSCQYKKCCSKYYTNSSSDYHCSMYWNDNGLLENLELTYWIDNRVVKINEKKYHKFALYPFHSNVFSGYMRTENNNIYVISKFDSTEDLVFRLDGNYQDELIIKGLSPFTGYVISDSYFINSLNSDTCYMFTIKSDFDLKNHNQFLLRKVYISKTYGFTYFQFQKGSQYVDCALKKYFIE